MIGPASSSPVTRCTVAPVTFTPCSERLLLGIDAGERRQQRRMDVEHGVRKGVEQPRADQTHETGEADEAHAALAQFAAQAVRQNRRVWRTRDG